ncbi:MAG TPA: universal stress protein [Bacteroidales bacterium]|jgi:nucleotide-binding universal stress UspA family protein|nr:universal stress protein [Bacteroidales bacterium]MDI9574148.1 universal stress protein [Bacteroidota bacterium]OQC61055.1 MAG: universal stress protein UspE [Bacteroidetes bacterium ADurb.Bin012]MBP9588005.1 universal stress protein [Bacteroidales bacterium]HNQ59994.1 universal stress protein [Bacteroidales bacterium]
MKRILVPVDFSDHTFVTASYAFSMAKATGAEILLFHAVFDQFIMPEGYSPDSIITPTMLDVEFIKEIRKEAEEKMAQLFFRLKNQWGEDTVLNAKIESGAPDIAIQAAAEDFQADLIVLGAVGLGRKDHFSGGTAEYLMKHSQKPVLAIPVNCGYKGLNKAIYAVDPAHFHKAELNRIQEFFKPFHAEIHYLVLCYNPKNRPNDSTIAEWQNLVSNRASFQIVDCDHPQEGLHLSIRNIQPDIIAFHFFRESLFSRWFKPALSRKDLYKANLPLLSFPEIEE